MRREICKFKTGSKKVLPADSAAALSPPDPSHYRHGRPLDIQLMLPGHCAKGSKSRAASSLDLSLCNIRVKSFIVTLYPSSFRHRNCCFFVLFTLIRAFIQTTNASCQIQPPTRDATPFSSRDPIWSKFVTGSQIGPSSLSYSRFAFFIFYRGS